MQDTLLLCQSLAPVTPPSVLHSQDPCPSILQAPATSPLFVGSHQTAPGADLVLRQDQLK